MGARRPSWTDLRDQIESHYDQLGNSLEVGHLLPILRSKGFFDKNDADEVQNQVVHKTSSAQAGCLVDKVIKRGPQAMKVLVDHLEIYFPSLYHEITGKEPNPDLHPSLDMVRRSFRHATKDLSPDLLRELYTVMQEKNNMEKKLKNVAAGNTQMERHISALRERHRRLKSRNEMLEAKAKERDKVQEELNKFKEMLIDSQNRSTNFQQAAEEARQHARLATFKLFQYQWEVKELQNKVRLQRSETKRLQQSVKSRAERMVEHETKYYSDRQKLEELQKELEKIENVPSCGSCGDGQGTRSDNEPLMGRVKDQLQKAHQTNENLSLRLQRVQEACDMYKGKVSILQRQLKMVRENMIMNRQHLEESQAELQFVCKERDKEIEQSNKLHKLYSESIIERDDLMEKLTKARKDIIKSSMDLNNAVGTSEGAPQRASVVSTESSTTSGVSGSNSGGDVDNYDADSDSDDYEELQLGPITRPRLERVISRQPSADTLSDHATPQHLHNKFEEFDFKDDVDEHAQGSTASGPPPPSRTDSVVDDYENLAFLSDGAVPMRGGRRDQKSRRKESSDDFQEGYDFQGLDDEDEDESTSLSSMIDQDAEFFQHTWNARRSSRNRNRALYQDRRRSRSLSRLQDFEGELDLDMVPPTSCYRMFSLKKSMKRLPFLSKRKEMNL